jgi:hypothetical protein
MKRIITIAFLGAFCIASIEASSQAGRASSKVAQQWFSKNSLMNNLTNYMREKTGRLNKKTGYALGKLSRFFKGEESKLPDISKKEAYKKYKEERDYLRPRGVKTPIKRYLSPAERSKQEKRSDFSGAKAMLRILRRMGYREL